MSLSMSASVRFLIEDSSSSDESDLEEMILDDNIRQTMIIIVVKKIGPRLCLHPMEPHFGHATLMQDYFSEVTTYPSSLFRRRYRMR
jgi:hypothetical protein